MEVFFFYIVFYYIGILNYFIIYFNYLFLNLFFKENKPFLEVSFTCCWKIGSHDSVGCKGGWECEYMAFQSPEQETGSVNKEGGVGTGNWLATSEQKVTER